MTALPTLLEYRHATTTLEGIVFHDESQTQPLPGILLIHEFMGLGDYMLPHAKRLAEQGYAVLLCDMYGKGIRPKDKSEASALARTYREDRLLMRSRAQAGLNALANLPMADANNLFAIGFSFGGCAALELARSGASLAGTVSFYGYLNTPLPCRAGTIKGAVLVLHGAHDKVVPMTEIPAFENEMRKAGVDSQVIIYDDAGHGFTNATHENDPATGSWFCEKTAERAWAATLEFLARS